MKKRKRKQQKEIIQNLQLNNSGHSRVNFEGEKIVHPSVFQLGSQNYSKAPLKQKHQGTSRLPLSKKKKKKINQTTGRLCSREVFKRTLSSAQFHLNPLKTRASSPCPSPPQPYPPFWTVLYKSHTHTYSTHLKQSLLSEFWQFVLILA